MFRSHKAELGHVHEHQYIKCFGWKEVGFGEWCYRVYNITHFLAIVKNWKESEI